MQLLQRKYIDGRIQEYLKELRLPQGRKKTTRKDLMEALKSKGIIQNVEAPDDENVFTWPFDRKDNDDILFLRHCNISTFYTYSGHKWENRQLCITIGLFATFICTKDKPDAIVEEIHRIDTQLIPQWNKDFQDLRPEEITKLATDEFVDQMETLRKQPILLDTQTARIFAVPVTSVRQVISRNKNIFTEEAAFHLNFEEMREHARKYINPPKVRKSDYHPYALTQQGFLLLSMHLNSSIAVKMHICIIQTVSSHITLRQMLQKLEKTSHSHNEQPY